MGAGQNAYVAGITSGVLRASNYGLSDIYLAKYSTDGNQQWITQFGSSSGEFLTDIAIDNAGNISLIGFTSGGLGGPNVGGTDGFLAKFSSDGSLLWTTQLGSNQNDSPYSVTHDALGNIYIAGETQGQLGSQSFGNKDAFVAKFDTGGTLLWTLQLGTSSLDGIQSISIDADRNVFVTGRTDGTLGAQAFGGGDVFVAKISTVPEPSTIILFAVAVACKMRGRLH
jgi:hypothetical protein